MALTVRQSADVAMARNQEALRIASSLTVGNVLNDRAVKIITPKLPLMAKGYADSEMGRAVLANVVAGLVTHFLPANEKASMASKAMVDAAMVSFVGSFNIEEMVNEFLDGVNLDALKDVVPTSEES